VVVFRVVAHDAVVWLDGQHEMHLTLPIRVDSGEANRSERKEVLAVLRYVSLEHILRRRKCVKTVGVDEKSLTVHRSTPGCRRNRWAPSEGHEPIARKAYHPYPQK
jgi:hypothetical protein